MFMNELTAWGRWLKRAMREKGISRSALVEATGRSSSTISMLMRGSLELSDDLREDLARALKIPLEEVPSTSVEASEQTGAAKKRASRSGRSGDIEVATLSYYPTGSEPAPITLTVIDNGIPDHTLPLLANELGFFAPLNIEIKVEQLEEKEYPAAQNSAFQQSPSTSGSYTLVCGPIEEFKVGARSFVSRVNEYMGYALIAKSGTKLPSVHKQKDGQGKLDIFVAMMKHIIRRNAAKNVAFVDDKGKLFYQTLLNLYGDLDGQDVAGIADDLEKRDVAVLDSLDEIGDLHADFAIGHAYSVAAVLAKKRYKLLLAYKDVSAIIEAVQNSPDVMSRLLNKKAPSHPSDRSRINSAVSILKYQQTPEESRNAAFAAFRRSFSDALYQLKLNNAWALNLPFDRIKSDESLKQLACRLASVAYRTVEAITNPQKSGDAMARLHDYAQKHKDKHARFRDVDLGNFTKAWNVAYRMTSFDDTLQWLFDKKRSSREFQGEFEVMEENRESLKTVSEWMVKAKDSCDRAFIQLAKLPGSNSKKVGEHLRRARHHYGIFNYYDAARFASDALRAAEEKVTDREEVSHGRPRSR